MRDQPTRFRYSALAIFAAALAVRLVHVWQIRRSPFFDVLIGDARAYDAWAQRIAGGEWIGREVFYQAPLYPYVLGVIYGVAGRSLLAVRVVQAVVGALSSVLLAGAGRRFFGERAGMVAGSALAIYAPAIFFDGVIQKSTLDLFFIALILWLIARIVDAPHRRPLWLALGGALGALSLTRENALVFIVVIGVWCSYGIRLKPDSTSPAAEAGSGRTRNRARDLIAIMLGLAVVLLPVAIRNYAVGGGFYLTTAQFGPNLYIGNNPEADGSYSPLRFGRGAPEYERQDASDLAEHALNRSLTPAEVSRFWTDRAVDFITTHPLGWLRLEWRKLLLLVNATETLDTESQESYAEWSWPLRALGWIGHFGVLVPLAALGAILAWPQRRRIGILYVMTGAYAASVLVFYVFARYRLPLVPFLILFAADALVALSESIRNRDKEPRDRTSRRAPAIFESKISAACAAAALGMTVVASNWPLQSKRLLRAITETNLATALQEDGRTEDAMAHYQRAIDIEPDYAPALNNLGVALRATGALNAAIAAYERALTIKGDYPDAHYNLANALLEKNRAAEAAAHFEIALRSIPDSAGVRNNLGVALAAAGKPEEAIAAFRAAIAADPNSANAHRNLGDALTSAGQIPEGIAELRRATTLDPNDSAAHYDLGSVLLENGQLDEAIAEFRSTLRVAPQSVEAHNNLGIALGSQGQLDAAIDEFRRALAIDPSFADAKRNLTLAEQARRQARGRR